MNSEFVVVSSDAPSDLRPVFCSDDCQTPIPAVDAGNLERIGNHAVRALEQALYGLVGGGLGLGAGATI